MADQDKSLVVQGEGKVISPINPTDPFESFLAGIQGAMPSYWCSVARPDAERDSPEYREYAAHVLQLLNSEDGKVRQHLKEPLPTTHLLAHPVKIEQDNGELVDALRVVMDTKNHGVLSCTSTGIAQGLQRVMTMFGPPPWNPPVDLYIEEVNTRKGRRTYVVSVRFADKEPASTKK